MSTICCSSPLQDGGNTSSEGSNETEGFDGEIGFKRCVPFSTNIRARSEISPIRMAPANIGIQLPTLGLSSATYTFTKLLKLAVALLRKLGVRCILYLDNMLIIAQSKQTLLQQLATAIDLQVSLRFIINLDKSVVKPTYTQSSYWDSF